MMKRIFLYLIILGAVLFESCTDNDSFSTDSSKRLSFSVDTLKMDTVFSTVPSSTYSFWVYNNSGDGLRIRQVRLERGNQTGLRVNVDGFYLDNTAGSLVNDLEIRKNDSIRVFVELTSQVNKDAGGLPQMIEDNLAFLLESGVTQKVNLRAYSWDAIFYNQLAVKKDTTISTSKPVVIYGGIVVDSAATLTIKAPTTLYFHSEAGITVYGRLVIEGDGNGGKVVLRGDRMDRMFPYLPYDRVSGQWGGIRICPSSTGNRISDADIHSGTYGIICDSAAFDSTVYRLSLSYSSVHNCKGPGIAAYNANISLVNCQVSNTADNCISLYGGAARIDYCTLAQFYPYSADRGAALYFSNFTAGKYYPQKSLRINNSLITGYNSDVFMGEPCDSVELEYYFSNSVIRTPEPEFKDTLEKKLRVNNVVFETKDNEIQGKKHFKLIDEENLIYDFHLDSLSTAIGKAAVITVTDDKDRKARGGKPDAGCYQFR